MGPKGANGATVASTQNFWPSGFSAKRTPEIQKDGRLVPPLVKAYGTLHKVVKMERENIESLTVENA